MDPQAYLALTKDKQDAYMRTLTPEQRLAFVQAVQNYESANITPPLPPVGKKRTDPAAAIASIPSVAPLPPAGSERSNPAAEIAAIKPDLTQLPAVQSQDLALKTQTNRLMDRLSTLATVASTFTDMANMSNPENTEVLPSAIAGGVSGFVNGGPVGAITGLFTGAIKAGTQREAYEQAEFDKQRKRLNSLRVAPTSMETGGVADTEASVDIPYQEEKGEMMLFPDGKLVESMATKTHKQMKPKEVTDFLPSGTVVFSNSEKRLIDLSKIKDDIFIITKGDYSEDGNVPGETVTMGDVYGKKGKKTPAQLARWVQKQTPIIEKPIEQIEVATNEENMRRRKELLTPILQMQEGVYKKFEFETPEKMEKGGVAMKKKKKSKFNYADGGVTDPAAFLKMPRAQRDAYLASLPTYEDRVAFMDKVNALAVQGFADVGITPPVKATPPAPVVTPPAVTPPVAPTAPIAATPPISGTPPVASTTPSPTPPDLSYPTVNDDVFKKVDESIAASKDQVEQDYTTSMDNAQEVYRSNRFKNFGRMASKLAGIGFQNPVTESVQLGTDLIDQMYPNVTESQIQGQVNAIRQGQNRVLSTINDSGISGTKIGSAIASTQARVIDAEGDIRDRAQTTNLSQTAKRFERLKAIRDLNATNEVAAENATRSARNKMVSNVGEIAADTIKDQGDLKTAIMNRREELNRWRQQNQNQITQNEFNNIVKKEELRINREWQAKMRAGLADIIANNTIG